MNWQITDWEKIFAKHVSDIGLYLYKEDSKKTNKEDKLNTKKTNNPFSKKWAKYLNRYFTKEDT